MGLLQRLSSVNLSVWVIIGALSGILCGVFFGEAAANLWIEAMSLYTEPSHSDRRLACAGRATAASPDSLHVRSHFAMALADAGRFAEAKEQLEWCLAQRRNNKFFQRKFREVVQAEMDQGAHAVAWYPEEKTLR